MRDVLSLCMCVNFLMEFYKPNLFAFIYFVVDIFISKIDLKIHHILGIISIYMRVYMLNEADQLLFSSLYVNVEISTILLTISPYIKHKLLKNITEYMFLITFIKYRIYDYYIYLYNPKIIHFIIYNSPLSIISYFGLFGINIYWFIIIIKKLSKPFLKKDLTALCQSLVSYTYFVNIPISIYMYRTINFEVISISLLSLSSYLYHSSNKNIYYSYFDTAAIHLRILASSYDPYLTGWLHMFCVLFRIIHINDYHELTYLCIFLDTVIQVYYIQDVISQINHILVLYLFTLVTYINPFYDLSYFAIHILLMVETYLICKTNNLMII